MCSGSRVESEARGDTYAASAARLVGLPGTSVSLCFVFSFCLSETTWNTLVPAMNFRATVHSSFPEGRFPAASSCASQNSDLTEQSVLSRVHEQFPPVVKLHGRSQALR